MVKITVFQSSSREYENETKPDTIPESGNDLWVRKIHFH
jgi:hypothetical protein